MPSSAKADDYSYIKKPLYLNTEDYGTYAVWDNKLYQWKGEKDLKQVLNLGKGTTAKNKATGMEINDWRSFYITDLAHAKFYDNDQFKNV